MKICFGKLCSPCRPTSSANHLLRNFVAASWPNAGTGGASIRDMYERIAEGIRNAAKQEEAAKQAASAEAPQTNGQVNGLVVKQE